MLKDWKGIAFVLVVAATAAVAGAVFGVMRAQREMDRQSSDTTTGAATDGAKDRAGGGGGTSPSDMGKASRTGTGSGASSRKSDTPAGEEAESSPWLRLFADNGEGVKDENGRRKRSNKPHWSDEFRIGEETARIEFVDASVGLPSGGEWRGRPAAGDLDGDGSLDIVCSIRKGDGLHVFYGDGRGNWTERETPFPENLGYGGSDIADFNGDGLLDIVFATHGAPAQMYFGDGRGTWKRAENGPENQQILQDVAAADFDSDGATDVVAIGWAHGGIVLAFGSAGGTFRTTDPFPGDDESFGHEVLTGDVDADGRADFIVTMGGPRVFLGDGKGKFRSASRGLPVPPTKGTNFGIAVGDVTGDGTLEVAVCFTAMEGMRGLAVYDRQENGAWTSISAGLPERVSFSDAEFADFDSDGFLDLAAYTEDNVLIWRGNGGKTWTPAGRVANLGRSGDLTVGDANGDGSPDLITVFRHGVSGVRAFLKR